MKPGAKEKYAKMDVRVITIWLIHIAGSTNCYDVYQRYYRTCYIAVNFNYIQCLVALCANKSSRFYSSFQLFDECMQRNSN